MLLETLYYRMNMNMIPKTFTLYNGLKMPSVGLGTWQQRDAETVKRVVKQALAVGYRLIDTASAYRNEPAIGESLASVFEDKQSMLRREDVWITSKLSPKQHGFERATAAVNESLHNLRTDYIDLYLIHWPGASGKALESPEHRELRKNSWIALEKLYREGKVRAIGVSNYTQRHLKEMIEYAEILPMVNQCEVHPLCPQPKLLDYCKQNNIVFTAYASLGESALVNGEETPPKLDSIFARRGNELSRTQILLLWGLQHGVAVIPKATSLEHLQENMSFLKNGHFLTDEDMAELNELGARVEKHYCWHADKVA